MRQGLKWPLIRARDSFYCHIGFKINIQFRLSNAFSLFKLIDWQQNVKHSISSCLEPKPVSASKTIAYKYSRYRRSRAYDSVLANTLQKTLWNTLPRVGTSKHHLVIKPPNPFSVIQFLLGQYKHCQYNLSSHRNQGVKCAAIIHFMAQYCNFCCRAVWSKARSIVPVPVSPIFISSEYWKVLH